MSRSYKKTPRCGDTKNKFFKRYANHRLRRKKLEIDLQHKSYKKDFYTYYICDFETVGTSFNIFWRSRKNSFPTREEALKTYNKWYKRK